MSFCCYSLCHYVISTITGYDYKSFFFFCSSVRTLSSTLASPFLLLFLIYIACLCLLLHIRPYASSSTFLFPCPQVHFKNCLEYISRKTIQLFISLMRTFSFEKFSCSSDVFFTDSQVFGIFDLLKRYFLIWQFHSFLCLFFSISYNKQSTFLNQIPSLYPGCIFLLIVS